MQIRDLLPWSNSNNKETQLTRQQSQDESPVLALQRDMNRIFDDFWRRFDRPFGALNGSWGTNALHTDIAETDQTVEISVELPGIDPKEVDVSVADDVLAIRGEKKSEREENKKGYYLSERSYGSFHRVIPLPPGVDTEKVDASFKNGVLTVSLPKTPEAQSRVKKIEVKSS